MNTYVCTPRGLVVEVAPGASRVDYYDVGPLDVFTGRYEWRTGFPSYYSSGQKDLEFFPERISRAVSSLLSRQCRDIHEARVDFAFDQALKDTLEDIRRMFRNAQGDRWALARRSLLRGAGWLRA